METLLDCAECLVEFHPGGLLDLVLQSEESQVPCSPEIVVHEQWVVEEDACSCHKHVASTVVVGRVPGKGGICPLPVVSPVPAVEGGHHVVEE